MKLETQIKTTEIKQENISFYYNLKIYMHH